MPLDPEGWHPEPPDEWPEPPDLEPEPRKRRNKPLFRGQAFSYCCLDDGGTPEAIEAAKLDAGPIVGIDAEWTSGIDAEGRAVNVVLSYQYAVAWQVLGKHVWWSGGIYPARLRRKNKNLHANRLTMGELLDEAFRDGIRRGLINRRPLSRPRAVRKELRRLVGGMAQARELGAKYPIEPVRVVAHLTKAELSAFADFHYLKSQFDSVQKSFATMRFPAKATAWDMHRNEHCYTVRLFDSGLLSPANSKSLEALGKLLAFKKLDVAEELPCFYWDEQGRSVECADPVADAHRLPFRGVPIYIEGDLAKNVQRRLVDVWPAPDIKARMDLLLRYDRALFERYAVRDAEVCRNFLVKMYGQTGGRMSTTVSGLAVQRLKSMVREGDPREVLERATGYEHQEHTEYDPETGRMRTVQVRICSCPEYESTAIASAHGGRNECFAFGPSDRAQWNDFDISSAYGTIISGLGLPNWDAARFSRDPLEYRPETLGFARVRFKFPHDTRYPSIPVKDYEDAHGLIYPLEGETYVPAPEIATALSLGADITIIFGGIIPWEPFYLFHEYIRQCGSDREASKKMADAFGDGFYKLMANGLFGKFGQGLHGLYKKAKTAFNTRKGESAPIDLSPISSPFLASYITGMVRAAVSEMIANVPEYRTVLSVTTDGFLTDATRAEIAYGPVCERIAQLRADLVGSREILEHKAQVEQVWPWRTRGTLTLAPGSAPGIKNRVLAKAGVQVPNGVHTDRALSQIENDYMLTKLTLRQPKDEGEQFSLTSIKELFENDGDLVGETKHPLLNFEYDMKRELVGPPKVYDVPGVSTNGTDTHIALSTRPHRTMEAFKKVRPQFDTWRRERVLKTVEDWQSWRAYQIGGKVLGNRRGGLEQQAIRHFLRCYVRRLNGLPGGDYTGLVELLNAAGIKVTITDVKNAARASRRPSPEPVPAPTELYQQLKHIYPDTNWRAILAPLEK